MEGVRETAEASDMEGVKETVAAETAEASDMEGVKETVAASRILPGTLVLEFYPDTSSPSLPTRGKPLPIRFRDGASRILPPACVSESGRELCTCLVQTGAKSSPDSKTMLGGTAAGEIPSRGLLRCPPGSLPRP